MATLRQIEANKRNATFSRGPKTELGKKAAARNALKHGLLSEDAMLQGESVTDFFVFTEKLYFELEPVGELESALVGRLGSLLWRLKRVGGLEASILRWHRADVLSFILETSTSELEATEYGKAYINSADSLASLSRYETSIENAIHKTLHELERLQAVRKGKHAAAPEVVDIAATTTPQAELKRKA